MRKEIKDSVFIKQPVYAGGNKAMNDFISTHIKFPQEAITHKVKGQVSLMLTIDHQGNVTEVKPTRTLGHGCDEEAMRVAQLLQFTIPPNPRKIKVLFHKVIKINFDYALVVVEKSIPIPAPPQPGALNYSYQSTVSEISSSDKRYEYKISW